MINQEHRAEAETDASYVVPRSVGRVLDLLEIVLAGRRCNLTGAAAASGLTPTTALRHLRALEARGYLDRDADGLYSPGPTILRIAASLRDGGDLDRLVAVAEPHLEALTAETGESSYLAVSDGTVATYVAAAESDRAIRHVGWIGQNISLDGTAIGAAVARPGTTATRTGAVEADITAVSLALPPRHKLGLALSVVGPAHRLRPTARKSAEAALVRAVNQLQRDLGPVPEAMAS
ncbi:MAG: helix-turn-helix domain-containing protein [Actinomycetia bacterium]|nr:helix-turn-helix domain-containing protein [Actinomycetes bacterium]MCP4226631.1 helix-turn-helix domain-containing protein [Actinomycetes bacterium]MCP5035378.1 helix-turn-helix domain-containing protein [Actinomycetes bacterium]